MRARWYEPAIGRLLSRDPVQGDSATPASINAFDYATANPLRFTDPSGACIFNICEGLRDLLKLIPEFSVRLVVSSTFEGGMGDALSGAETYSVYAMAATVEHGGVRAADDTLLESGGMFTTSAGQTSSTPAGQGPDFGNQSTGGYLGPISGGFFVTNATDHEQLLGAFQTIKINLGIVVGPGFEFSYSPDHKILVGSVTYGFGLGADFTTMQTITGVRK